MMPITDLVVSGCNELLMVINGADLFLCTILVF